MNIRCTPARLSGTVEAISSKSDAHRLLICAALSDKPTKIHCNIMSKDIEATVNCLKAMGAEVKTEKGMITVIPVEFGENVTLDCGESGSTLRFLMPVVSALGMNCKIIGHGRLPERPVSPLKEEMERHGVTFETGSTFPLSLKGKLTSGVFELAGNVSSQFISGLLFALPLLPGESKINLIPPVQSRSYLNITLSALRRFGIEIVEEENLYIIKGGQKYISPGELTVEGDWSNSAFFLCAGALNSDGITVKGLNMNSPQGDKKILEVLKRIGADVKTDGDSVSVKRNKLVGTIVDASDIPDLVPVISVLAALCDMGATHIVNAERLRLKECDRLAAMNETITNAGGFVSETDDGMIVWSDNFLTGGTFNGFNDHRVVMSAAIMSIGCSAEVDIMGAEAVNKSYPTFFEDFNSLGGKADVINDGK